MRRLRQAEHFAKAATPFEVVEVPAQEHAAVKPLLLLGRRPRHPQRSGVARVQPSVVPMCYVRAYARVRGIWEQRVFPPSIINPTKKCSCPPKPKVCIGVTTTHARTHARTHTHARTRRSLHHSTGPAHSLFSSSGVEGGKGNARRLTTGLDDSNTTHNE